MSQTITSEYAHATAVEQHSDTTFTADLDAGWKVGGAVNGGYLLGVVGRALSRLNPATPDPLVISTFYLGPSAEGPAEITTRTVREGRATATYGIDLSQNGAPTISAMATMGNLGELPDDVATTAEPPQLPPPEECISTGDASEDFLKAAPIINRFDQRLDPDTAGFAVGKPSGRGLLQGWIRLKDGTDPDPLSLLTFLDSFPPVMFDLGRFNWAPTMELTAHVRALPAPGWIKAKLYTRNIAGGMFEEDCELWDSAGRLVAQSRQLARQPRD
jgi:acyl-CoA thioesterase